MQETSSNLNGFQSYMIWWLFVVVVYYKFSVWIERAREYLTFLLRKIKYEPDIALFLHLLNCIVYWY